MRKHTQSAGRGRTARWLSATCAIVMLAGFAEPAVAVLGRPAGQEADRQVRTVVGTLPDGTDYRIRMPHSWNGTLALYSHGLVLPGDANPVRDSFDEPTADYLLDHGTALAGSAFGTGWAVEDALRDQRLTLDAVTEEFGKPKRVIAYGDSLGGMISTALVERFPGRFAAGLAMCGVQAGGVGAWNHFLDSAFVFKTLVGPQAPFTVSGIADPLANFGAASESFAAARHTAAGRARLALTAAVAQLPGAIDPSGPTSAPTLQQRFQARTAWLEAPYLVLAFAERGEMEARAGGNPSWNTGVDYGKLLRASGQLGDVRKMYDAAGLDLGDDLTVLAGAKRVKADANAIGYLKRNVTFTGDLHRPVLTMRNVSDGALPSSHDRAYRQAVTSAGRATELRQVFLGRPGHCTFTGAETVTALNRLLHRVRTGYWGDTRPAALNRAALALGPGLNQGGGFPVPPAFVTHHPLAFPRQFTLTD